MKRIIGFAAIAAIFCLWILSTQESKTAQQNEFRLVDTAAGKMRLVVTPDTPERRAHARNEELTNAHNNILIDKLNWSKEGFNTVMVATFYLKNNNKFDVKDITIQCALFAPSGTLIDTANRTLYEVIKANSRRRISKFNMGFAHSQAKSARCEVTAARV